MNWAKFFSKNKNQTRLCFLFKNFKKLNCLWIETTFSIQKIASNSCLIINSKVQFISFMFIINTKNNIFQSIFYLINWFTLGLLKHFRNYGT